MATKKEITKILSVLVAAYPNAKIVPSSGDVPGTIEVYATMLADMPPDELLAGVKYCINTHPDFMPTIATIREAVGKLHADGKTVSGADAWGKVKKAMLHYSADDRPEFDDPAVARAVEAIGWRNLSLKDETDFATRAQFIKAYETFAARIAQEDELLKIPEAKKIMLELAERKQNLRLLEAKHG